LIYKEAELDIDPEAGGTDLCPFDCECCKSKCPPPREGYLGFMLTQQASDHADGSEHGRVTPALPLRDGIAPTIDISMHEYDIDDPLCDSTNLHSPEDARITLVHHGI
jgi:hypothetical protein